MFLGVPLSSVKLDKNFNMRSTAKSDDTIYSGPVKLIFPDAGMNSFHSILGITPSKEIIHNTNSFLVDSHFKKNAIRDLIHYDNTHSIFRRLIITYNHLVKHEAEIAVDREMFLLVNPFSASNIGHDLSILFDRIHYYKMNKLTMPVVVAEYMNVIPRSLEICRMLLPDTEFFFIPSNKIINFTKLIVPRNIIFNICLHRTTIIKELIDLCYASVSKDILESYKNKKVILMKTNINKQVITSATCFKCSDTINILTKDYDFLYINPEIMPMRDIILYLVHAKKIVTSFGAISYAHAIFFNPDIKYDFIFTNYSPYYDVDKNNIIKMPLDIDSNKEVFIRELTR
jgi:hypothetical protein